MHVSLGESKFFAQANFQLDTHKTRKSLTANNCLCGPNAVERRSHKRNENIYLFNLSCWNSLIPLIRLFFSNFSYGFGCYLFIFGVKLLFIRSKRSHTVYLHKSRRRQEKNSYFRFEQSTHNCHRIEEEAVICVGIKTYKKVVHMRRTSYISLSPSSQFALLLSVCVCARELNIFYSTSVAR